MFYITFSKGFNKIMLFITFIKQIHHHLNKKNDINNILNKIVLLNNTFLKKTKTNPKPKKKKTKITIKNYKQIT